MLIVNREIYRPPRPRGFGARDVNTYYKYSSGEKCWTDMCDDASSYRVHGKTKDGKSCERKLRRDAVIGYSLIINPPSDMTVGWTHSDYMKFYNDTFNVLYKIQYEYNESRKMDTGANLFRAENVRMISYHRDEGKKDVNGDYGQHVHVLGDAKDANGRYCGNLLDAGLLAQINRTYPALMRDRGWELDDLDTTDFHRMGKDENGNYIDPEYRKERLEKKAGRSVNQYLDDKVEELTLQSLANEFAERIKKRDLEEQQKALEKQQKEQEKKAEELKAWETNLKVLETDLQAQETAVNELKDNYRVEVETAVKNDYMAKETALNNAIIAKDKLIELGKQKEKEIQFQTRQSRLNRLSFGAELERWQQRQQYDTGLGY